MAHSNTTSISNGEIEMSLSGEHSEDSLKGVLEAFMPLAFAQLNAKKAIHETDARTAHNRFRAISAAEAMVEVHLHQALRYAQGTIKLLEGQMIAEELGFPEFNDEADEDLYQ